ncbi:alpha/beta fold hydrolase, partial [Thermodesulfobacteriota bacterium]
MSAGVPEARFIEANGIRMAVYEHGSGTPVVFSHGFPELAYSWRYQLPALARAGFRAIAPDQRGYGKTECPEDIESYDIHHLCGDMVGLLDTLRIESAVFCGHDWGGLVVWQMPLLHPDRVAGVIGVNTPFIPRAPKDPIRIMRSVFGDGMYIVQFQEQGKAEVVLEKDVERTFRFFFRKSAISLQEFEKLPPELRSFNFLEYLEAWDGSGDILCSPEELAVYVKTFKATGFAGGINWYRNMTRNWETTEGVEQRVEVPSLMISAADDVVLPPSMTEGMEQYVPDLEKRVIEECGHWTQLDSSANGAYIFYKFGSNVINLADRFASREEFADGYLVVSRIFSS